MVSQFMLKLKTQDALALVIHTGAWITVAIDAMQMVPVFTDKTINNLLKWSKGAMH